MNGPAITIRDAVPEDVGRLLEIYDYYVRNTAITFEYETPSPEVFLARMETTQRRYPYLVILSDGHIEGYACAGPFKVRAAYDRSCETTIYLAPEAQKRGLGRALYEVLEQALRKMGILNLYACIGLPEQDDEYLTTNSADFHAHLGYRTAGIFHKCGYKFGRWYDMTWMEKLLGEHGDNPPPVADYPSVKNLRAAQNKGDNTMEIPETVQEPCPLVCQCCGMPLTEDDVISREKDGSLNRDYCKWCYADGEFAYKDKASLLDFLLEHMPNPDGQSDAERRAAYDGWLSQLKHWKT